MNRARKRDWNTWEYYMEPLWSLVGMFCKRWLKILEEQCERIRQCERLQPSKNSPPNSSMVISILIILPWKKSHRPTHASNQELSFWLLTVIPFSHFWLPSPRSPWPPRPLWSLLKGHPQHGEELEDSPSARSRRWSRNNGSAKGREKVRTLTNSRKKNANGTNHVGMHVLK